MTMITMAISLLGSELLDLPIGSYDDLSQVFYFGIGFLCREFLRKEKVRIKLIMLDVSIFELTR